MKFLLGIILVLLTGSLTYAGSISGFILVHQDQVSLVEISTNQTYPVRITKVETLDSLKKMKNMDFIQGQGEIINNEVLLDSIDFVGLQKLLGLWASNTNSFLDFKDFSKVVSYQAVFDMQLPRTSLHYSIAPSSGTDWKIFFTDSSAVLLASLVLVDQKATLKFYDLASGQITKTVELTRVSQRH